jgi:hypothetical protein
MLSSCLVLGSLLVDFSRLVVLLLVELVAHGILGGRGAVDMLVVSKWHQAIAMMYEL